MAWSDPGDFTSGQILTAAQMDSIREAMFFGQGTFADEAARDTAYNASGAMSPITLQEGMRAYLTAPTVPAASGGTTMVPTGATTIYNGSAWVCVTEIGARSSTSATTSSTSYVTTLTSDTTAVSVTLVTGTTALIMLSGVFAGAAGVFNFMSVSVSGATTIAAADNNAVRIDDSTFARTAGSVYVLSGLTAGTNTFTLAYKSAAAGSTFLQRRLVVKGIA